METMKRKMERRRKRMRMKMRRENDDDGDGRKSEREYARPGQGNEPKTSSWRVGVALLMGVGGAFVVGVIAGTWEEEEE